tara:strand:+ start:15298 stop:15699 length:402 start_codon:yes stop_codon:yes gene_type:complete
MKFDVNRLSRLAGLPGSDSDSGLLSEAGNRSKHEDPGLDKDDAHGQGKHLNETQADEEVLEIDEVELHQEIKRLQQDKLAESRLREAVRDEIKAILEDVGAYQTDGKWVYGDNQPTNSKEGLVNLAFPGIGFR